MNFQSLRPMVKHVETSLCHSEVHKVQPRYCKSERVSHAEWEKMTAGPQLRITIGKCSGRDSYPPRWHRLHFLFVNFFFWNTIIRGRIWFRVVLKYFLIWKIINITRSTFWRWERRLEGASLKSMESASASSGEKPPAEQDIEAWMPSTQTYDLFLMIHCTGP